MFVVHRPSGCSTLDNHSTDSTAYRPVSVIHEIPVATKGNAINLLSIFQFKPTVWLRCGEGETDRRLFSQQSLPRQDLSIEQKSNCKTFESLNHSPCYKQTVSERERVSDFVGQAGGGWEFIKIMSDKTGKLRPIFFALFFHAGEKK